ncbi:M20/M25/M40 family metallo-hydrolase [Kordia sp. YSTF-M3]|uniref:M20/M25/M40 family metallo-hydrolase n=1 Tax=Kordia aestuariivivens TaxID=2759037 RepID=A0ABR7QCH3_9FLAO|nr:M20/M25/M40 family metallo-hydrolase [Kordia aestuariivivens]MBC8756265.1 M20/M25/M40 family metallo-hydrolase [Kordia aestuariivivens]
MKKIQLYTITVILCLFSIATHAQINWDTKIQDKLPDILKKHRELVSIPNVASDEENMMKNVDWVTTEFEKLNFNVSILKTSTLPVFLAEKEVDPKAKTILFYLHLDGQAVNPAKWNQKDPFRPVLKEQDAEGNWQIINWSRIKTHINPDWRVFGRAAADDKAPIIMMLSALELLQKQQQKLSYNIKIILDLQEETRSEGFLSTLETYKKRYAADYLIIMDGPAHPTNKPTLTFGCRGVATCNISIYGAKLPQHSGHYGNYAPNPVFRMSHLLASMKDDTGKVVIDNFYDGIELDAETQKLLAQVPDDNEVIRTGLGIAKADNVGKNYQESLQYPSLNVRHIETSWKGPGLKTIIPEIITAYIDVRLVRETDGATQLEKIKKHIEAQGYLVLDRDPTDAERLKHPKIAKLTMNPGINAFRTDINSLIGTTLRETLENEFDEKPILIRTMGGTVPITPAIQVLNIPAIIVPMVNMDNNQHNPNENIRIGNISQGIKMCLAILSMKL